MEQVSRKPCVAYRMNLELGEWRKINSRHEEEEAEEKRMRLAEREG